MSFLDLAEEAATFEEFREAANSFFQATDEDSVTEWEDARQAVRSGEDPKLDPGLDLRRETGNPGPGFEVREVALDGIAPALNHFAPDQPNLLAA